MRILPGWRCVPSPLADGIAEDSILICAEHPRNVHDVRSALILVEVFPLDDLDSSPGILRVRISDTRMLLYGASSDVDGDAEM